MGVEVVVRAFAREFRHVSTGCMTLGEPVHSRLGKGWETPTSRISVHQSQIYGSGRRDKCKPVTWPTSIPSTTGMNGWEEVMDECKRASLRYDE